ncbi:ST6GAL1 [Branchiostoma lanceolatum]|uniref:beta-galactoside alpha-(2,6)-sialyltransferase n=1 Tax=Branchiostoma lanceolatum TaxID=7740 RepID=A0A8K0AE98_BRALA|nr:ST6GAL1 [Branchiostoma lanceolatum]
MLCNLKKKVPFSTITRKQASKDKNNGVLPEESLEKLVHFNSCAVVSSSHALRLHTYGREIDSHDAVLRFNCAPTHTFEQFVGKRTDIRLINTLIPHRKCGEEFWSENSVVMMMHLCDWVHVYEFVPSNRDNTTLIYYFAETAGRSPHDLHSYNQERTYVKTLSLTPDEVINDTGVVLIQGLSQTRCG